MRGFANLLRSVLAFAAFACAFAVALPASAQTRARGDSDCSSLSEFEFQTMAEELFTRIFTDPAFIESTSGGRPSVVIGDLDNDSHSYRLETDVMFNALRNVIIRSQAVRLFAPGADYPDLTLAAQLTSTYIRNNGGVRDASYTLNITLTRLNGEYLGAWSVQRSC